MLLLLGRLTQLFGYMCLFIPALFTVLHGVGDLGEFGEMPGKEAV